MPSKNFMDDAGMYGDDILSAAVEWARRVDKLDEARKRDQGSSDFTATESARKEITEARDNFTKALSDFVVKEIETYLYTKTGLLNSKDA